MEQIIFKKREVVPAQKTIQMRVGDDDYERIKDISTRTGETTQFVLAKLIKFGLERVVIEE